MRKRAASIRNKVRYAYFACVIVIIGVILFNYYNIKTLNEKIAIKLVISDFFNTTLEMRRYEKNFFLYKDRKDYLENVGYSNTAGEILKQNREEIERLLSSGDMKTVDLYLREYRGLMQEYYLLALKGDAAALDKVEGRVRDVGKMLISFTEEIFQRERQSILSLISTTKQLLIVSIVVLAVAGYLIGQFISIMVVRPLKQLEQGMQRIADGRFEGLSLEASEHEVVSLRNAFKRMLQELDLRQKRLMLQSEKLVSLGTMVSGVAHELNNPLSNISSSCQILLEEVEDADLEYKKELLRQIEAEVDRAKATVRNLLEFSRKKDFKIKKVRLKELTDDTLKLIQGDIPSSVEFSFDIPEDCWITVDKQRMQQAMLNIIKNGMDAILDEGTVSVSAKNGVTHVEIKISDTGTGIEPDRLKRIFEPFYTTKAEGKGSGLGLFITREIIEEHGGSIDAVSDPGSGTAFIINLPVKELDEAAGQNTDN